MNAVSTAIAFPQIHCIFSLSLLNRLLQLTHKKAGCLGKASRWKYIGSVMSANEGEEGGGGGGFEDGVVEEAYDTEGHDAEHANPQAEAFGASTAERGYLRFLGGDVHCLYNKEIVVKRYDCVDKGNEHQHIDCHGALVYGRREDEELAEESCKRWYTGEGEHGKHHRAGQPRVGFRQAVVVGHRHFAGLVLDGSNHTEGGKVGEDVDEDIVHHRGQPHLVATHDAEHDVAGL